MNKNAKSLTQRLYSTVRGGRARIAAAGTAIAGFAASGIASAQNDLGAAALTEVSGIRADVGAILAVLVLVVFALVAWAYFKKVR